MAEREKVLVKIQRPLFTNKGSMRECVAYVVDPKTLEQVGNEVFFVPDKRDFKRIFGKHLEWCKVYCEGEYNPETKYIELGDLELVRKELWA